MALTGLATTLLSARIVQRASLSAGFYRASSSTTDRDTAAADAPDHASPEPVPQGIAAVLPFIACPLTKAPLRYDKQLNKLVCDELGVAYSVTADGVPQLVPHLGEILGDVDPQAAPGAASR
ncbi:hypothetical protein Agub_g8863 [Astrephomene gubernaculifera]|uniref:Protein preY, mitochondrial n=1 Tax=Astrephomene gubernaculifera TaxID=47775 RepID=A0AAD3DSD3_9CHLO|nr:hypothetical protein Agub_g8863 [Astrephomene gubernaculifera]